MIQQSFTCDICGIDKKEANHWFMAFEEKGTLKFGAWGALNRKRHVKHLCGQRCVHRFLDDFLAGHSTNEGPPDASAEVGENAPSGQTDDREMELPVE